MLDLHFIHDLARFELDRSLQFRPRRLRCQPLSHLRVTVGSGVLFSSFTGTLSSCVDSHVARVDLIQNFVHIILFLSLSLSHPGSQVCCLVKRIRGGTTRYKKLDATTCPTPTLQQLSQKMKVQGIRDLAFNHLSEGRTTAETAHLIKTHQTTIQRWRKQGRVRNKMASAEPNRRKTTANRVDNSHNFDPSRCPLRPRV